MNLNTYADGGARWAEFLSMVPQALMDCALLCYAPAGGLICLRDAPVSRVHMLLRGNASAQNITADGKVSSWVSLPAPTFVGDLEVLSEEYRYASGVSAVTDCTLAYWPADRFMEIAMEYPRLLLLFSRVLARKDYEVSTNRGRTAFRSNLERTAMYLLQYCRSAPPAPGGGYILKMTRNEIASEVFFSLKTLDRCLRRLQAEGALSIVHGKVHITQAQLPLLEKFRDTPDFISQPESLDLHDLKEEKT